MLNFINGYNTSPSDISPGDAIAHKVVAVCSEYDWAAYKGSTLWSDEMVARQGDKIPEEAAKVLFYCFAMSGRKYRS